MPFLNKVLSKIDQVAAERGINTNMSGYPGQGYGGGYPGQQQQQYQQYQPQQPYPFVTALHLEGTHADGSTGSKATEVIHRHSKVVMEADTSRLHRKVRHMANMDTHM
jgi:hypothetical protein